MIYDIAGLRVSIENKHPYSDRFCAAYLSPDQSSPAHVTASATAEEILAEKAASPNFSDGYVENICIYRSLCLQLPTLDRFLLHAAVLAYEGEGYAFLGRSGTGKSTHTGLWLKYLEGAKIVNGDKPIVRLDGKEFRVYGTPWMGKEGRGCNDSVILKGLCFLEQAKENSIRRLTPAETAMRLFTQILMPTDEENAARTLELADKLVETVPSYLLKCDISETAMQTSFEMMTGKDYKKHEGE